jgi:hypothetical protein
MQEAEFDFCGLETFGYGEMVMFKLQTKTFQTKHSNEQCHTTLKQR